MKRPQGFDRPPTPIPPVERPTTSASRGSSRQSPAPGTRRTTTDPGSGPGLTSPGLGTAGLGTAGLGTAGLGTAGLNTAGLNTEPIPVQARTMAPTATLAPVSPLTGAPVTGAPTAGADPRAGVPLSDPAAAPPARTAGAARAQFRAARRARKRYERDEVRRFTWRARRRRRAWLAGGGVAAALVLFTVIGVFSPLMALRTIEVTGTSRIQADQVQAALADQLGTPLPLLDAGKIKAELGTFTLIQSFVTESRPPGTLVVRIVERQPVGVIPSAAGFDLVDAAGVVIQSTPDRPAGYPALDAGGVGSPGFLAAAQVVGSLPEGIRSQLDTVTAGTADDVTLSLAGGARVVWGSAEKSDYKAVVLAALMVGHPVGSVSEYDVSSPDSAVLR
jgi:cell division protein FtsQ